MTGLFGEKSTGSKIQKASEHEDDIIDLEQEDFTIDDADKKITTKVSIAPETKTVKKPEQAQKEKLVVSSTAKAATVVSQKSSQTSDSSDHIVIKIPKIPQIPRNIERMFYLLIIVILIILLFVNPFGSSDKTDDSSTGTTDTADDGDSGDDNVSDSGSLSDNPSPTPTSTPTSKPSTKPSTQTGKCSGDITLALDKDDIKIESVSGNPDAKKINSIRFTIDNQKDVVFFPEVKLYIYDSSTKGDFEDFVRATFRFDTGLPACKEYSLATMDQISPKIFTNLDEEKTIVLKLYEKGSDKLLDSVKVDIDLS